MTHEISARPGVGAHPKTRLLGALASAAVLAAATIPFATAAVAATPDTTPPTLTSTQFGSQFDGFFIDENMVWHVDASDESGVASISWRLDGAATPTTVDGSSAEIVVAGDEHHLLELWATDTVGNVSAHKTYPVTVDHTPPVVTLPTRTSFTLGEPATFTFHCLDVTAGAETCDADVPNGAALDTSVAGTHTVNVWSVDYAGWRTDVTYSYTVSATDVTAPTVTALTPPVPASGWFTVAPFITISAADPSGIAAIFWSVEGAENYSNSAMNATSTSIPLSYEGVNTITYYAIDKAGNRSANQVTTVRFDRTAPAIVLPSKTAYELGVPATLSYSCFEIGSGIDQCSGDIASGAALTTNKAGTYTVHIDARDVAGNTNAVIYTYTVADTVLPGIDFFVDRVSPTGWHTRAPLIQVAAHDYSGIASIHYATRGAVVSNKDAVGSALENIPVVTDGITEITYWAVDGAGNKSTEHTATVKIDTHAPQILLGELPQSIAGDATASASALAAGPAVAAPSTEPATLPSYRIGESVPFPFSCLDGNSGVDTCTADIPKQHLLPTGTPGTHTVTITAIDAAGNRATLPFEYEVTGTLPAAEGSTGGLAATGVPVEPYAWLIAGLLATGAALLALRWMLARRV